MSSSSNGRPKFVGMYWLQPSQGFSYEADAPEDLSHCAERLFPGEWGSLLGIYERLRSGEPGQDRDLFSLVESAIDEDVRLLAVRLLGHTASLDMRTKLSTLFFHPELEMRLAAYEAALYAYDARLIDSLLAALGAARRNERLSIMSAISHLLEPEPAILCDELDELSDDAYREVAYSMRNSIEGRFGETSAVFEGGKLDLGYVADRIETLCADPEAIEYSGTISTYFDILEAVSGFPCPGVFDDEIAVRPGVALGAIAAFRATGEISRFEPGKRYFFGHRLVS